jgi:hypothetical protein
VPAGRYRLKPRGAGASGWLMVGIGRDQFSLHTEPLAAPPEPVVLDLPVDVRAIVVRGDEQARRSIRGLTIEPISLVMPGARLATGAATKAVRYRTATVFFLDDRSFPEPEAFWVGGGRTSEIVVQPDAPGTAVSFQVRNGPSPNQAVLRAGAWTADIPLASGEERRIEVPLGGRGATLLSITATGGFRPSEVDAASRDTRFLGLSLKVE